MNKTTDRQYVQMELPFGIPNTTFICPKCGKLRYTSTNKGHYTCFCDEINEKVTNSSITTIRNLRKLMPKIYDFWKSHKEYRKQLVSINKLIRCTGGSVRKIPDERLLELSKQYKTKKEIRANNNALYNLLLRRGLMNRTKLQGVDRDFNTSYVVYRYFFRETNTIYIGLSINPRNRDRDHRRDFKSAVFKYANKIKVEIPKIEILENGLSLKEAQSRENFWENRYRELCFNVLNKGKTGVGVSSCGSVSRLSKQKCISIASEYETIGDLREEHPVIARKLREKGWVKECCFKDGRRRIIEKTITRCINAARRFDNLTDFARNCPTEYNASSKHGLLQTFTWLKRKKGRKGKKVFVFSSSNGELIGSFESYKTASTLLNVPESLIRRQIKYGRGSISEYIFSNDGNKPKIEMRFHRPNYWTYTTTRREAMKYNTRSEFDKGCPSGYRKALKEGWLDDFFPIHESLYKDHDSSNQLIKQEFNFVM